MIERKIIIGLITSTDFIKTIKPVWNPVLLESGTAKMLGNWCLEYYSQFEKAPGKQIEDIFFQKSREGLDKDIAEEIEQDILPDLSDEYTNISFDSEVEIKKALTYLNERSYLQLAQNISNILENGKGKMLDRLQEVERLRTEFKPILDEKDDSITLRKPEMKEAFEKAFQQVQEPILKFPKQLGEFWNSQFIPGGFISLLATEKRGKTWWLLEFAVRAMRQGRKVAFFQAGDMNESEQLKRLSIYLTKTSNLEKFCEAHYQPVRDCIRNQKNMCNLPEREMDYSCWEDSDEEIDLKNVTYDDLMKGYENNSDWKCCYNCKEYDKLKLGTPWLKLIPKKESINEIDAIKAWENFCKRYKGDLKLKTCANGTLSFSLINSILDIWQLKDNWVADIIIIDYMDLIMPEIKAEYRHQQNDIWKRGRKLSQTPRDGKLPLVISPTQADSAAYNAYRLKVDNFSEDKRKYAHTTAFFGLNQDPQGREKRIGLMRINKLMMREDEFTVEDEVTVLQDIKQGRPLLGSYFS